MRPPFAAALALVPALRDAYVSSDDAGGNDGRSVAPYGVMILCRKELSPTFTVHELPTMMARTLLVATIHDPSRGGTMDVATVHLESLDSQKVRAAQLEVAHGVLSKDGRSDGGTTDGSTGKNARAEWCVIGGGI